MHTLKDIYKRNDILLLFIWKKNEQKMQRPIWQPQNVLANILSYSETELVSFIKLHLTFLDIDEATDVRVYLVGTFQELFPYMDYCEISN